MKAVGKPGAVGNFFDGARGRRQPLGSEGNASLQSILGGGHADDKTKLPDKTIGAETAETRQLGIGRRLGETPIIVLSVREQDATKVLALDSGADDYVTKPFSAPELLARVRVQLRRVAEEPATEGNVVEGDFAVDLEAHRVTVRGEVIHLTPKEFDLLLLFLRNVGRVLTHKQLLRAIWGTAGADQPEYLRVLVAQLRKKIDDPDGKSYVENEPWIGYRFRATA